MSSVFKSPKVKRVETEVIEPEVVDKSKEVYEIEKRVKKKMGAVSQILAKDNSYTGFKDKLGM